MTSDASEQGEDLRVRHSIPLFSIITPSLNRAALVGEALESVHRQAFPKLEHIVVDGGSKDGTLEVLARYPHLRVISEPDTGMYDALNKGIFLAKGDVVGFLNADDAYTEGAFDAVAERFSSDDRLDAVCGGADVFGELMAGGEMARSFCSPRYGELSVRNITLGQPILNARFFRRRLFDSVGLFDPQFRIAGDREWLLRLAFAGVRSQYLPRCLYRYRSHAGSMTFDPSRAKAEAAGEEYWTIAERSLQAGLPANDRLCLKVWHARVSSEMVLQGWRRGDGPTMCAAISRGFRGSVWWPVLLCRRILLGLLQRRRTGALRLA